LTVVWRRILALAAAVALGVPLALFFVMAPLFCDGPAGLTHPERLASYAVSAGAYLVGGLLAGLLGRRDPTMVCALTGPGAFVATFLVLGEGDGFVLAVLYVGLAVAASSLGVWAMGLRRVKPVG
jgi:hypothetical protein